jgi:hypothetical protein
MQGEVRRACVHRQEMAGTLAEEPEAEIQGQIGRKRAGKSAGGRRQAGEDGKDYGRQDPGREPSCRGQDKQSCSRSGCKGNGQRRKFSRSFHFDIPIFAKVTFYP